jgi:uncharacterized protein (DUF2267 family)
MSATGIEAFDKSLQVTNTWLNEIMEDHGPDRQRAWHILGVVLRTICDRLPADLAAHLGAQLPLLVRGAFYDRFEPSHLPDKSRTREEFLHRAEEGMQGITPVNPDDAVQSVFQVLSHHLAPGQVTKVRQALPEAVRRLWPEPGVRQ